MSFRITHSPSNAASGSQPAEAAAGPVPHPHLRPKAEAAREPLRRPASSQAGDLDVGVIYTHERDLIGPLLSTMKASAPGLDYRLILVDNRSRDGIEAWRHIVPETAVLVNRQRLHYAANMNRIVAASTARYVLLMNTDMFFDPRQRCLSQMVQFMDAHPACGVAGCRLLHADGHEARAARRFQTLSVILARRFGLGIFLRRTLERYFYMDHAPGESFPCQWLSGCFLMLRREAVEKVGLFDECFGKYFEDVNMCLRMARGGWHVMYHGATSAYHIERRASRNLFSADAYMHLRSYFYWLSKWGYRVRAEASSDLLRRGRRKNMTTAVIFDMDGVLVDSEPIINAAAIRALAEFGIAARPQDFEPFVGAGEDRYVGGVAELHGRTYVAAMKHRTYDWYLKLLPEMGKAFPGARDLVEYLHRLRIACAVASSADRVKVEANLTQVLQVPLDRFAAIVTGEDVFRRKPHPDIFLEAARRLDVPPAACCVIEDAVHGVEAAKAAGMRCIAVTTSFATETLAVAGADVVKGAIAEITLGDLGLELDLSLQPPLPDQRVPGP